MSRIPQSLFIEYLSYLLLNKYVTVTYNLLVALGMSVAVGGQHSCDNRAGPVRVVSIVNVNLQYSFGN